MRGWFIAPATTNYRFYMACDDWCRLNLGDTPMNAENTTQINYNTAWNAVRDYWDINQAGNNPNRTSQWIALEEGEHYYIQGQHLEGSGGDHFSVAVEIEATADNLTVGHHQSMREIQKLTVETGKMRETTRINVTNADGGEYLLIFTNPRNNENVKSERILTTATVGQFANSVKNFYKKNGIGSNIDVNLTQYDADGNVTTNSSLEASRVYHIVLQNVIGQKSATKIQVIKVSTSSDIQVELPENIQLSDTPLSQYYRVKCIDHEGYESLSNRLYPGQGEWAIQNAIMAGCDRFYDTLQV